jgi:hypothetical protein
MLLRCIDSGFGGGISPEFRTVEVNVITTIGPLMFVPETKDMA